MDEIKLRRGTHHITLKKIPTHFAVRLKQGRARDERALAACCGTPEAEVTHVDTAGKEKMDVFMVREATKLEKTMEGLRKAPGSEVVTHMYKLDDTPGSAAIPTGAMTLQFKPDVAEEKRDEILAQYGLQLLEELDFLPHGVRVGLTAASSKNPLKIAYELQQRPEIQTAEPDLSVRRAYTHVPTDSLYSEQWHLRNRGGTSMTPGADVKAEEAWDISRGSPDIIVCVMDDGFDLGHPDFASPGKIVAPRDFGDLDTDPLPGSADDNHGTACAGVAIADENGSGVVGLAPRCRFMPVRTSGWISDDDIRQLFQYAIDNHADVISCSWSARDQNFPLSTAMNAIIHKAATEGRSNRKGCVILFAAGNESRPLNGTFGGQPSVQGFAIHPDVIAVGASTSMDVRSHYSNLGPELTICAPSSGAGGRSITTTDRRGGGGYMDGDYTNEFGGTSSATPLAAGLAALILSVNPELTSAQVRSIMRETADKIDQAQGQYVNGHSPKYGHGRINALKALGAAAGPIGGGGLLERVLYLEHRINRAIPDQDRIEDTIPFPLEVTAKSVEVGLDIEHTYRGDLRVSLITPQGQEIVLSDRAGGSQDNLVATFRSTNDPGPLRNTAGQPAKGEWRLRVSDLAAQDVGKLRKWSLAIGY